MSVAQWEREAIGERTREALRHKKASGQRVGTLPYGFQLAKDGRTLEPRRDEQRTLEIVCAGRRAGRSLRAIADELNARGLRTRRGTAWKHQYVAGILRERARRGQKPHERHEPNPLQVLPGTQRRESVSADILSFDRINRDECLEWWMSRARHCWEFRASGFVPIRRRRLDVPTDPVVSLLRVLRLLPGDLVNHHLATYEDGPGHL